MKPEAQVQSAILEYLAVRKIWGRRMNTGAIKVDKRFIRFGSVGMADILAILPSTYVSQRADGRYTTRLHRVCWIECKAPKGKQSKAQAMFQQEVQAEGHMYCLCRSIEDVAAILD